MNHFIMQSIKLKLSLFFMSFFVKKIQYSLTYAGGVGYIILYGHDMWLKMNSKKIETDFFFNLNNHW